MMALAIKKKKKKHREKRIEAAISQAESFGPCPWGCWLICTEAWNCLTSRSRSRGLSPLWFLCYSISEREASLWAFLRSFYKAGWIVCWVLVRQAIDTRYFWHIHPLKWVLSLFLSEKWGHRGKEWWSTPLRSCSWQVKARLEPGTVRAPCSFHCNASPCHLPLLIFPPFQVCRCP